jgi:hypothetical protein
VTKKNAVFWMWRRVDLVWTDVSEELIASIFRVEKSASDMSLHTRSTQRHIPEDDLLHSNIIFSSTNRILRGLLISSNRGRPLLPFCPVVRSRGELYTSQTQGCNITTTLTWRHVNGGNYWLLNYLLIEYHRIIGFELRLKQDSRSIGIGIRHD